MNELIKKLEAAPVGSRELDLLIMATIEPDRRRRLHLIAENVTKNKHAYTTSIDAKLPGENIVQVVNYPTGSEARNLVEKTGETFIGVGSTEPLARRIAAMKARDTGERA